MGAERIFADTNLFLRYLTNDVPVQAEAVEHLLRRAGKGEVVLATNSLVMAEIVWTLESYYHLPAAEIQSSVLAILNTPGIYVNEGDVVLQAVLWYAEKNVDYVDAYSAAWMSVQGISTAYTFDRKHFARFEGISVITPE